MRIQKIQEQTDRDADKWDIKEKHNSSKLLQMVRGNTKKHHGSRENFQAKSKKGYNTSKKTEKK